MNNFLCVTLILSSFFVPAYAEVNVIQTPHPEGGYMLQVTHGKAEYLLTYVKLDEKDVFGQYKLAATCKGRPVIMANATHKKVDKTHGDPRTDTVTFRMIVRDADFSATVAGKKTSILVTKEIQKLYDALVAYGSAEDPAMVEEVLLEDALESFKWPQAAAKFDYRADLHINESQSGIVKGIRNYYQCEGRYKKTYFFFRYSRESGKILLSASLPNAWTVQASSRQEGKDNYWQGFKVLAQKGLSNGKMVILPDEFKSYFKTFFDAFLPAIKGKEIKSGIKEALQEDVLDVLEALLE